MFVWVHGDVTRGIVMLNLLSFPFPLDVWIQGNVQ